MIRLFVIEDHSIIVDGLKHRFRHLTDKIIVAGWSDSIQHLVSNIPEDSFDIIILDLWLPGTDPIENLSAIKRRFPNKPVVIYTNERSTYWIKIMMEQGVKAYLIKDIDSKELKAALEKVHQGKTIISGFFSDLPPSFKKNEFLFQKYYLKPSEHSIVFQISMGESLKNIADQRSMTVSAVEKVVKAIRKRMDVKTNPELIRVLIEQKLL